MDVLENIVETHYPMDNGKYYVAEVHMAVGNRINQEADYWVCKYGTAVKLYLGNTLNSEKVKKMVRTLERDEYM